MNVSSDRKAVSRRILSGVAGLILIDGADYGDGRGG